MTTNKARELILTQKNRISKNILRITLKGKDLNDFPSDSIGAHIKLLLNHQGKKIKRTYTVREFRPLDQEIDIDFTIHENPGPACNWAINSLLNQAVFISGPGTVKFNHKENAFHIFAVDITALPAATAFIQNLKEDQKGVAFIEVRDEEDIQVLKKPKNFKIKWLVNNHIYDTELLLNALKNMDFETINPNIFVAGESSITQKIRTFFKPLNIPKNRLYITSYWRVGLIEEKHKIYKKENA